MKKTDCRCLFSCSNSGALAGVKIEHWVASSGARVYFVESRILPMLDVQVDFAAGSMFDPAGKSGTWLALTRATLDNGAGKLDETRLPNNSPISAPASAAGPTPTAPASRCARCRPATNAIRRSTS